MKNIFFAISLLTAIICKPSYGYEFTYDAETVLNYNAEESVFYCAGIHSAALQYTKREQGIDIPTASLLEHVTHKLIQFTGARNSRVSELVIKGYDDMNNCAFNTIANSPEFNECMRIAHKCQDISEDFYKQFQN